MPSAEFRERKAESLPPRRVIERIQEHMGKNREMYPNPDAAVPYVRDVHKLIEELEGFKRYEKGIFDEERESIRRFVGVEKFENEMEKFIESLSREPQERLYVLSDLIRAIKHMEDMGITKEKLEEIKKLEDIYEALPPGLFEKLLPEEEIPMNEVLMRIVDQHEHKSVLSRIAGFFKHLFGL